MMRDVGGLVKILQPDTKSAFESHTIIRPVCLFWKTLNQHGSGRVIKFSWKLHQVLNYVQLCVAITTRFGCKRVFFVCKFLKIII